MSLTHITFPLDGVAAPQAASKQHVSTATTAVASPALQERGAALSSPAVTCTGAPATFTADARPRDHLSVNPLTIPGWWEHGVICAMDETTTKLRLPRVAVMRTAAISSSPNPAAVAPPWPLDATPTPLANSSSQALTVEWGSFAALPDECGAAALSISSASTSTTLFLFHAAGSITQSLDGYQQECSHDVNRNSLAPGATAPATSIHQPTGEQTRGTQLLCIPRTGGSHPLITLLDGSDGWTISSLAHHLTQSMSLPPAPSICRLFQLNRCRQRERCHQVHVAADALAVGRAVATVYSPPSCCWLHDGPPPSVYNDEWTQWKLRLMNCLCSGGVGRVVVSVEVGRGERSGAAATATPARSTPNDVELDVTRSKSTGVGHPWTTTPDRWAPTAGFRAACLIGLQQLQAEREPSPAHSNTATTTTTSSTVSIRIPFASLCRSHLRGVCKFGDECRFNHLCREEHARRMSTVTAATAPCIAERQPSPPLIAHSQTGLLDVQQTAAPAVMLSPLVTSRTFCIGGSTQVTIRSHFPYQLRPRGGTQQDRTTIQ